VRMMDAVRSAQPPAWYPWVTAIIGPVGVVLGGTLLSSGRRDPA